MSFARSYEPVDVDRNHHHGANCYPGVDNVPSYRYTQQNRRQDDSVNHHLRRHEETPSLLMEKQHNAFQYDRCTDLAEQQQCYRRSFRHSPRRQLEAERSERKLQSKSLFSNTAVVAAPNRHSDDQQDIEVFPGEYMRLRGADETWDAIQNAFYVSCICICCPTLELYCIQDAGFVLCPACKAVSPLDSLAYGNDSPGKGGIGLGFQSFDLKKWQREIQSQRHTSQKGKNF